MAMEKPKSADECVYLTQRELGDKQQGFAMVWVFKQLCPKCKKEMMGKPKDQKTGKVMIRAKEYKCPSCDYAVEKKAYEETLTASVEYTCPKCLVEGEMQIPFIRKKVEGVDTLRFECGKCKEKIDITKKMKDKKKKGEPAEIEDEDN